MNETLIDMGPLVAILNRGDAHHAECAAIARAENGPYVTTLPVLTEAMYLCQKRLSWRAQQALWQMVLRSDLILEHPSAQDLLRMAELMEQYRDHPMDFADASLVAIAERLSMNRIFTVDFNDLSAYRMRRNRPFVILGPHASP